MFSERAHYTYSGREKVGYNTLETSTKAAASMQRKYGNHFSPYVCPRCGKYHLGKNRNDRLRAYQVELFYNGVWEYKVIEANNENHVMSILGPGAMDFYHDIKIKRI